MLIKASSPKVLQISFQTLLTTEQHTKIFFLSVREPAFVVFSGLFFFRVLIPFYFEDHNFLISNPFSTIVRAQMCQKERFKF